MASVPMESVRFAAIVKLSLRVTVPPDLTTKLANGVAAVVPPIDCEPLPFIRTVLVVPGVKVPLLVKLPARLYVPVDDTLIVPPFVTFPATL